MANEPIETVTDAKGEEAQDGEVLQISKATLDALDRLRMFYRNNRGAEITRDQAIRYAADLSLAHGQRIVGTADGRRGMVRG